MFDLLAAIQSADPPSLVLWSMFVLAAGMYPVGFMLGSDCSPCCSTSPCSQCTEGALPDTVTVTFNGFTDQTPGSDLISLSFSSCFGGGASARVTAPGGDPATDNGPISAVSLTNAGSGYAKLGRVAPTLTISGGSGTGATFTPTLTSTNDSCGIPTWNLSSVAFKDGTGYADGEELSVTEAVGDTVAAVAVVRVQTTRTQPTLSASASGGSGATFTVTTTSNGDTPQTWGVSGVSVSGTTSSYADMTKLSFSGAGVVEQSQADAYIRTVRVQPTPTLTAQSLGSGAGLTATLTQIDDPAEWPARPAWEVSAIAITAGGTGYSVYDMIECTTDGQGSPYSWFYAYVEEVDEDGAILAVTLSSGGAFFKSTGEIDEVQVNSGGAYYHDDGIPTAVTVENGGQYYREDASEPPYVATVTVSISQAAPSDGTGAEITATVGDDPQNAATFGKITGLTIASGGASGYLAWKWLNTVCCGQHWNGRSVVLKRDGCTFRHNMCGGFSNKNGVGRVELSYRGPDLPPYVRIETEISGEGGLSTKCNAFLLAPVLSGGQTYDCSDFEFIATSPGGRTAAVSSGGEYDATYLNPGLRSCMSCCKGAGVPPYEIALDITDNNNTNLSGVYVRPLQVFLSNGNQLTWANFFVGSGLGLLAAMYSDVEGCNDCDKNCRIQIIFNPFGVNGGQYMMTEFPEPCVSVPVCNPYGSYTICSGDCANGSYDVTIGPA